MAYGFGKHDAERDLFSPTFEWTVKRIIQSDESRERKKRTIVNIIKKHLDHPFNSLVNTSSTSIMKLFSKKDMIKRGLLFSNNKLPPMIGDVARINKGTRFNSDNHPIIFFSVITSDWIKHGRKLSDMGKDFVKGLHWNDRYRDKGRVLRSIWDMDREGAVNSFVTRISRGMQNPTDINERVVDELLRLEGKYLFKPSNKIKNVKNDAIMFMRSKNDGWSYEILEKFFDFYSPDIVEEAFDNYYNKLRVIHRSRGKDVDIGRKIIGLASHKNGVVRASLLSKIRSDISNTWNPLHGLFCESLNILRKDTVVGVRWSADEYFRAHCNDQESDGDVS